MDREARGSQRSRSRSVSGNPANQALALLVCVSALESCFRRRRFWQESVMSLEALGIRYPSLKGLEWALTGVLIATIAVVA
jgi:hypothetical protein